MHSKRSHFKTFLMFLFCLVFGIALIVPLSSVAWGYIRTVQDTLEPPVAVDAPPIGPAATIRAAQPPRPTGNRLSFSQAPANPLGTTLVAPTSRVAGFAVSDPMDSFVKKIRDAKSEDDKQDAIEDARATLEKQYDRYLEGYQKQVDEMEARMQKLRDQLEKRKNAKDRLVDLKLEMLLSKADGLGWPEVNRRFPTAPTASPGWPSTTVGPFPSSSQPQLAVRPSGLTTATPPLAVSPNRPSALPALNATPPNMTNRFASQGIPPKATLATTPRTVIRSFDAYFEKGISLLEDEKYTEFLDSYLDRKTFLKSLESKTLSELANDFKNNDSQLVLDLFKTAARRPAQNFRADSRELTWELQIDGKSEELNLIRDKDGSKWYFRLQNSDEEQ